MFRINLLMAWRNLLKNRMVSSINILGLTLGLACALLAIVYSYHELTYENSHKNADRICRVYISGDFGSIKWIQTTWGPEGEALRNMFPEIEKNSLSRLYDATVRVGDNLFNEKKILFADSAFFSIYTVSFIGGQLKYDPTSLVISEKTAGKYFAGADPVGKTMLLILDGQKVNFTVTGVYKDFPSNTEVQGDIILPFTVAKRFSHWKYSEYESTSYMNTLLLKPGTDIKALNKKIAANFKLPVTVIDAYPNLMPIKDMHLNGDYFNNYGKLLAFLIGGILVLVISCINYVNLTNILFSARNKEIGARIVNGARRFEIFKQFICDTAFSTALSFVLALMVLYMVLPDFNAIMDTHISLAFSWELAFTILGLFSATVLLSGVYPAIKISLSHSVDYFKSTNTLSLGKNRSLWTLTTFQFIIAVVFIQIMMVLNKQNHHLTDQSVLGCNPENVICTTGYAWGDLNKVKTEMQKEPSILSVSWANALPMMGFSVSTDWKEKDNKLPANRLYADVDYLEVYQIKMLQGRYFSKEYNSDIENAIVINRKTAEALGYTDPVGRMMFAENKQRLIIGVVDSYMALPPIFEEMPQLILPSKEQNTNLLFRIDPAKREKALNYIKETLQRINPDYPVELKYHLDYGEEMAKSYYSMQYLVNTFFIISIITALFGLFGLSVFIAERHRKEIGIRKVCGASSFRVINQLSKGLLIQVLIAISLASPITLAFSRVYLSMFPKHIKMEALLLMQGGMLALVLMMFTVAWQSWRAATRNPVESLRYE